MARLAAWEAQTTASVRVESLPGEHFFDDEDVLVRSVVGHLQGVLGV